MICWSPGKPDISETLAAPGNREADPSNIKPIEKVAVQLSCPDKWTRVGWGEKV